MQTSAFRKRWVITNNISADQTKRNAAGVPRRELVELWGFKVAGVPRSELVELWGFKAAGVPRSELVELWGFKAKVCIPYRITANIPHMR